MTIAAYAGEGRELARREQILENAKKAIVNYPTVSSIFRNLEDYSQDEKIVNPVVLTLSEAASSVWCGGKASPEAMAKIGFLEKTLAALKSVGDSIINKTFTDHLTAKDYTTCDSVLTELDVYTKLKSQHAGAKILWGPKVGTKRADILFNGFCNVCIEITSLYTPQIDLDLKTLYEQVAKEVWKRLPEKRAMSVRISTERLVWKADGPLDVEASKKRILKDIEDLACFEFFKPEGEYFRFATLTKLPQKDKPMINSIQYMEHYDSIGQFILEHKAEPVIHKLIETVTPDRIEEATIHGVMAGPAITKVAEVQSEMCFPSAAGEHERRIFITRIQKKLESKRQQQQINITIPNVLIIRAFNWTMAGYSYDKDESIRDIEFEPIRDAVEGWLQDNPIKELAAVLLYEQDPRRVQIIKNPKAEPQFRLESEQIVKLLIPELAQLPQTSSSKPSGH